MNLIMGEWWNNTDRRKQNYS